jgi:hypothetical protein
MKTKSRTLISTVGVLAGALLLAGCGSSSTPAAGVSAPVAGGSTAPASAASGGGGAGDTSTSKITNSCSVVTAADVVAAFGGTWDTMGGYSGPLTCAFDLTGNESSSAAVSGTKIAAEIATRARPWASVRGRAAQPVESRAARIVG